MPPVNLSAPGWIVLEGQAVWRAKSGAPEIAGDLLLAREGNERTFLQFTKMPFPFVTARVEHDAWMIEFPLQKESYGGHGQPPSQIGWFQLTRCLDGGTASKNWIWTNSKNNRWRLENESTGELIEGYLNP